MVIQSGYGLVRPQLQLDKLVTVTFTLVLPPVDPNEMPPGKSEYSQFVVHRASSWKAITWNCNCVETRLKLKFEVVTATSESVNKLVTTVMLDGEAVIVEGAKSGQPCSIKF